MAKIKRYGSDPSTPDDWRARMDCETLMQAEEIESDPKRLAAAKKYAAERLKQITKVAYMEEE